MPLQVLPLGLAQVPFLADTLLQEVRTNPIQSIVYKDKSLQEIRKSYEESFGKTLQSSEQQAKFVFLRAIDTDDTNVAWAQWQRPAEATGGTPRSDTKTSSAQTSIASSSESAQDPWSEFQRGWQRQDAQSRAAMLQGRSRYWLLCNIATHSDHRRRGAAALLTAWPFEAADQEQVPCILHVDSEGPGLPLYLKLGFTEVTRFDVDLRVIGGSRVMTFVCMIREPNPP